MRIAHFIPAYRQTVHAEVAMSLARDAMFCASRGWVHMPFFADVSGIARARNIAVDIACKNNADMLYMQDSDCFALPNMTYSAIEQLHGTMARTDAAVVGAVFCVRNGERVNCEPAKPGEVYEGIVGTGMMLVDLRKLNHLPRPWFVHEDSPDGLGVTCGEDVYFCKKVRDAGHRVIVDYSFPTGHAYMTADATIVSGQDKGRLHPSARGLNRAASI